MTGLMTAIGSRCALKRCRGKLRDDEGVGVLLKDRIVWMHSRCARLYRQRQKKREQHGREKGQKKR